jgi:hypothetical protein
LVLVSIKVIMSFPTQTTYVTSFPKRNDITGAPDQVFKFDNFLDYLTGGIRPLGPSTQAFYASSTSSPLRSIMIYLEHPSLSLEIHPIRRANSA